VLNDVVALPNRIVLVLDDYHLIEAQAVHDALNFLLAHLPPGGMHLVIATREDPPLPLARLRARGQLTELRASDLRFSSSEAAEFLNQVMGLDLSEADVAALERRTEGWIAGLQLAAVSMQGRKDASGLIKSFTGSHRYVLDYLMEEVLEHQSEYVQAFLLQTAVLIRLTGSLCDALTGQNNGQATLEMLERANLFIMPLDKERRWYRYHHLFLDLLRQRLCQERPDWVPKLHIRASEWYERNGLTDEAIEHALRAQASERVACLIDEHADAIWQAGEHTRLRRWLTGLPADVLFSRPDLCILHAWTLFTGGQQDAAEQSLQAAEKAIDAGNGGAAGALPAEGGQQPDPDKNRIRGRVATIRAFLASYWGDVPGAIQYARQALETLPEQDLTWRSTATVALSDAYSFSGQLRAALLARRDALEASKTAGNIYMALIVAMKLAVTLRTQGHLQQAIEICQQHVQLAEASGWSQTPVVGCLLAVWGEVLAELNDLDGALERATRGVDLTERGGDVAMISWSNLCLMMVLFSRGDMAGAGRIMQKMQGIAREHDLPTFVMNSMAAWQARIWLSQDELDAAVQWMGERGLVADGEFAFLHDLDTVELTEYVGIARILIAQGRLEDATTLLQHLLSRPEAFGYTSRAIQIHILQALAFDAGGTPSTAMATLEQALALAEPEGFVRIFVNEGPPMARLLKQAAAQGIMPDYTTRLLAAFQTTDEARQTTLHSSSVVGRRASALVEPLSKRELDVLQLIAEGLTNREVASRLFVSLNTVKAHTRNLYGKLDVHSRTQAIARSQELGLLARE
jgi:LuxR family maltose regulon positive regulatory protein